MAHEMSFTYSFLSHSFLLNFLFQLTPIYFFALREECPNTEFFLVRFFPAFGMNTQGYGVSLYLDTLHAVQKLRIWTLLTLCWSKLTIPIYRVAHFISLYILPNILKLSPYSVLKNTN